MPREVDTHTRRAAHLLTRLERAVRTGKGLALSSSDADTLARNIRDLTRQYEAQKLLAETMAQNPTLSTLAARERATVGVQHG